MQQGLTHPLIPAAEAIANDVKLGGDTQVVDHQRIEHVGQEHAAARGGLERGAGVGGRAGHR